MTIMRSRSKARIGGLSAEYVFLIVALIFGALFMTIIPPMTAPDEIGHFAKSYAFSQGEIIPYFLDSPVNLFKTWDEYGFNLPASILELNQNSIGVGYNVAEKFNYASLDMTAYEKLNEVFVPLGGQLNYSFFQYLPQIIGISISKLLVGSILPIYYTARLFNFLSYVLLLFFAVRWTKFAKWGFVVLALNPMFLFLAVSTSGDAFTNAVAFLFVAILSNIISENILDKKKLYFSFGLMVAMVQMKPTLIMFGLLYFLIPNKIFTIRMKMLYGSLILFSALAIYYLWGKLFPSQDIMYMDFANPSEQVKGILKNPISFVTVIKNTIEEHGKFLLHSYAGQFGLLNRNISFLAVLLYYLLVIFAVFIREYNQITVTKRMRFVSLMFIVGYVLLTFIALYQIWSPVGHTVILGLQGRYFIPIGAFALLTIVPNRISLPRKFAIPTTIVGIVLFLCYVTIFLTLSYGFLSV
ncbi:MULTISPECIES: DUF2142 domain-containing protein [unclassified Streptococcus]|uniref:DUF2142 domain-containing protein n=1 Tax=unclassified Streptococcus TaxID=2608887 RepID=UPI001071F6F1|nr:MULTISPECIES: DUF2142 domain-containing protein [unclassified Streptococcus]MBF0786594.1 DUF2142 domain-containing protein [Streptococcus sp. 19428wC2_LYSM12]MCQ9210913.1 DUF2142 domain-containing protein [Streptococcus sp. B01]MCQ9214182.1 DUF2142 domain-containing protein [Streptococcus sp. O1]TFV06556.1 DUF2142 domain-containing protein [Streptococcus sp. LYSM12]